MDVVEVGIQSSTQLLSLGSTHRPSLSLPLGFGLLKLLKTLLPGQPCTR